jgi:hypothetical protein
MSILYFNKFKYNIYFISILISESITFFTFLLVNKMIYIKKNLYHISVLELSLIFYHEYFYISLILTITKKIDM